MGNISNLNRGCTWKRSIRNRRRDQQVSYANEMTLATMTMYAGQRSGSVYRVCTVEVLP